MKLNTCLKICKFRFAILSILLILVISCNKNETPKNDNEELPQLITSTVKGGDWFDPNTWNEKVVPTANTDVNITGRVVLKDTAECLNLMIDASSQLIIEKNAVLKVKHHFVNEGIVVNDGDLIIRE